MRPAVAASWSQLEELVQLPSVVYVEPTATYTLMNDRARDLVGATPLSVAGWLAPLQQRPDRCRTDYWLG